MLEAVSDAVDVPVIASGGAGSAEDFVTLFQTLPKVDAGLAASIFHFGQVKIPELKGLLKENNILFIFKIFNCIMHIFSNIILNAFIRCEYFTIKITW